MKVEKNEELDKAERWWDTETQEPLNTSGERETGADGEESSIIYTNSVHASL